MDTEPSTEDDQHGPMAARQEWSYTSLQHVLKRLIAAAAVIVGVGVGAGLITYLVRNAEAPTYEAVARFAISPNDAILSADPADRIESIAALDRAIVNATVSELLQSGAVAEAAAVDAGVPVDDLDDYDFDASEVPGAAVVRLSITGPDAETVSSLAAAVRASDLTNEALGVFDIRSIDRAELSSRRIAPSPSRDALAVGLAAMIATGAAVVLLDGRVRLPSGLSRPAVLGPSGRRDESEPDDAEAEAAPDRADSESSESELSESESSESSESESSRVESSESSASQESESSRVESSESEPESSESEPESSEYEPESSESESESQESESESESQESKPATSGSERPAPNRAARRRAKRRPAARTRS